MKEEKSILLVDDEADILEMLSYNLVKAGYTVNTASNGTEGIEKAIQIVPDIILLDVMMPEKDGIETCQELRTIPSLKDTLIIFLSARGEEFSQLAGFQAGANDYLTKTLKPRVLVSKINSMFSLSKRNITPQEIIEIGNLSINKENYVVIKDSEEFVLPKKEFKILYLLASNPDKVFNRDEILDAVWGKSVVVGERTVDVHIRRLREKLNLSNIQTLKGVGYKFVAE